MIEAFGVQWGTFFQGGTLVAMVSILTILLRNRVQMRGLANTKEADIRDHYADELQRYVSEVAALRAELRVARDELSDCEEECRRKLKELEENLWGEKRQRVSEQLSLINLILRTVDAPELQALRDMLERTAAQMERVRVLEQWVDGRP